MLFFVVVKAQFITIRKNNIFKSGRNKKEKTNTKSCRDSNPLLRRKAIRLEHLSCERKFGLKFVVGCFRWVLEWVWFLSKYPWLIRKVNEALICFDWIVPEPYQRIWEIHMRTRSKIIYNNCFKSNFFVLFWPIFWHRLESDTYIGPINIDTSLESPIVTLLHDRTGHCGKSRLLAPGASCKINWLKSSLFWLK